MLQELRYRLAVAFLLGNEILYRCAHPIQHMIRQEILLQYLLAHEVVADGRAHGFRYTSFLLGDDAGSERNPPSHDVFRRVRTKQHSDGNVVGDVTNDATNQWSKYVSPNHNTKYNWRKLRIGNMNDIDKRDGS